MNKFYHELRRSCHTWLYNDPRLLVALDECQIKKDNDCEQSCGLEGRKLTQRICVENRLKPRLCPIKMQRKCSMYSQHKELMDRIIKIHHEFNTSLQTQQPGGNPMGNRRKTESIATYIKTQLDAKVEKSVLVSDLEVKIKDGVFKTKQSPKALVTWYSNFHKKRIVIENTSVDTTSTAA